MEARKPSPTQGRSKMRQSRSCEINGRRIEEYYFAGEWVVYVDNKFVGNDYESICKRILADALAAVGDKHD